MTDRKRTAWNSTLAPGKPPKRTGGLRGGKGPERRTPIKKRNPARKRRRFQRAYGSEERVRWLKMLPCLVCRKCPTEVAHVKSRGAGGTAADTVPLCPYHHRAQHDMGIRSFASLHGLDLHAEAAEIEKAWKRLTTTEGGR